MTLHLRIFFSLIFICFSIVGLSQSNIHISGKILDKNSKFPMGKVDIMTTKHNRLLGSTNLDGTFSLNIPTGTEIKFSFVGMQSIIHTFNKSDSGIVLIMSEESGTMKEVVVTGFKQTTRETMTGSSVIISGKDLQGQPTSNFTQLLQGRVAGLNVQINNGMPGARASIQLRGPSSAVVIGSGSGAFMTPTSPLFVIDGVQVDDNANYEYGFDQAGPGISPLSAIPPEDIESVEVLKDAQATALYGSRGAYGVILVTTIRGKSEIPIVSYTGSYFVNAIPKLRSVIGGKQERQMRIQEILAYDTTSAAALALINNTPFLSDSLNPYYNNSTNWQGISYSSTSNQSHNVNISGGNQKFNYKTNIGYYNQKGIIENTGLQRYTVDMNAMYQPSTKFKLQTGINTSMIQNQKGSGVGLLQPDASSSSGNSSLLPPPSLYSASNSSISALLVKDNNRTGNVNANLTVEWEPIKHLRVSTNETYSFSSQTSDNFRPAIVNSGYGKTTSVNVRTNNLYNRNMITYSNTFNDKHTIQAYAFNELTRNQTTANQLLIAGTANDDIEGPTGSSSSQSYGGTYTYKDTRTLAYGGDLSYNFMTKYVIDFSIRTDGSSTNGPNSGWTKNPSVGLRWNFGKESLFSRIKWLDYGSMRIDWGRNVIPSGTIYDVYGTYTQGTNYNNEHSVVNDWNEIPNSNFKPTTNTQLNWAFEGGFLHNAINVTYEIYYKTVENQTFARSIPNINGFKTITTNELSNADYGHELTLQFVPFGTQHALKWNFSINGAYNRDVLTSLPGGLRQMIVGQTDIDSKNMPVLYRLGRNIFTNLLYNTKGVFSTDAQVPINPADGLPLRVINNGIVTYFKAGDPYWADLNGDYVIDSTDRVAVGSPVPKFTGGFNSFLQYKGFSLSISMSYTLKRDIINTVIADQFQNFADPTKLGVLVPISQYNFWKKPGDKAKYPNPFDFLNAKYIDPFRYNQTAYMEDGSYVKINSIQLSYNFKRDFTKRWGITSCQVYVTASNVATFSHYSGVNPENVTDLGYDNSNGYPNSRNYTLGVNIQF